MGSGRGSGGRSSGTGEVTDWFDDPDAPTAVAGEDWFRETGEHDGSGSRRDRGAQVSASRARAAAEDAPTTVSRFGAADEDPNCVSRFGPADEDPTSVPRFAATDASARTTVSRFGRADEDAPTTVSRPDPADEDARTTVSRARTPRPPEASGRSAPVAAASPAPSPRAPRRPRPAGETRPSRVPPARPGRWDSAEPAGPVARDDRPDGPTRLGPAPPARRGGVPVLLVLLLACVGAGLLGWMGRTTDAGAFRGSWEFSRLGGPWLVAGFAGGAIGGWRRGVGGLVLGIVAGAVIVGAGSVAYYGLSYWGGGNDAHRAAKLGIGWGTAGLGVGGVLGLVGATFSTALGRHASPSSGRRVGSWVHGMALGTLGGLLMGESIALLWVWDGGGLRTMATLEGLGGVAIVVFGAAMRSWRFMVGAVLASAAAATVAPIATTALRETLRTIGWAGV